MTLSEKIRREIEGLLDKIVDLNPIWLKAHKENIDQATSAILEVVKEELPKKKITIKRNNRILCKHYIQ